MMRVPFYKIQGAGNDCLVFESQNAVFSTILEKECFIREISHRRLGIGADQVLEILSLAPLEIQIWNCDGSRAEICGNGARSFGRLALQEGWVKAPRFSFKVSGVSYECTELKDGYLELDMGLCREYQGAGSLSVDAERLPYHFVNVGNPHVVIFNDEWQYPTNFDFKKWGARIESHADFPHRTNVEFIRQINFESANPSMATAKVEFWERGAGATASCGSGAVALAWAIRKKFHDKNIESVNVFMTTYVLKVRFHGERAFLSGPAEIIAKGEFYWDPANVEVTK